MSANGRWDLIRRLKVNVKHPISAERSQDKAIENKEITLVLFFLWFFWGGTFCFVSRSFITM